MDPDISAAQALQLSIRRLHETLDGYADDIGLELAKQEIIAWLESREGEE